MLPLQSFYHCKLSVIFVLIGLLSFGSLATAKPSWKDDSSTEQPSKGSGKGGKKNQTQTPVSDITITEHPTSLSILDGDSALFTVYASSSDGQEINYQWFFNGTSIGGATTASYAIESSSLSDQGEYSVSLSTSDINKTTQASLSIEAAPEPVIAVEISLQPFSQAAYINESLTLNVSATGSGTISYQWRKNGTPLLGKTSSYLDFASLRLEDNAQYDVIISNEAGSVISNIASVTVNPLTTISLTWDTPSSRDDGSALSLDDIASYNIYLSYEGDNFEETISVPGTLKTVELSDMVRGNYQLAVATTDTSGVTGSRSETVEIIIN